MKKLINKILCLLILLLPIMVFAQGSIDVSTSSLKVKKGTSSSFTIKATNATGRIDITSTDTKVATVNVNKIWVDNDTVTINVTGIKDGTATINMELFSVATYDEEILTGTKQVSITVYTPETPKPVPKQETPKQETQPVVENKSNNTNFKTFKVTGYDLDKVDEKNYKLIVNYSVKSIIIEATKEDNKASITGTGTKNLNVGENTFNVTITAEDGTTSTRTIIVTRKEEVKIENLDTVLKEEEKKVEVSINDNTELTKEELNKIKESDKEVELNYYDEDKTLQYSWLLESNKVEVLESLNTKITFEEKEEIKKASNNTNGKTVVLSEKNNIPKNTQVKVYVGDKFNNKQKVNIYTYNNEKQELVTYLEGITVEEGYVEYILADEAEYFIATDIISNEEFNPVEKGNDKLIIIIIGSVILLLVIVTIIIKNKKNKNNNTTTYEEVIPNNQNNS